MIDESRRRQEGAESDRKQKGRGGRQEKTEKRKS